MIKIKGVNNSLVFVFGNGTFEEYQSFLKNKFISNRHLFDGSRIIFRGEGLQALSHEEIASLQHLCLEYGMVLNNTETNLDKTQNKNIIIHRNVRSGQKIYSEGSIVIWGDVHESAELIATNNIIVLGKLEGVAHAGFYGDLNSIIFALCLTPSQIRIGDIISRSPKDYVKKSYPEIAYLEKETIYIKQYKSKDNLTRFI